MAEVSTFAEAVALVEARFKCLYPAPDGVKVSVISAGLGRSGDEMYCLSERLAVQIWLERVLSSGEGKSTIYWRVPPEMSDDLEIFLERSAVYDKPKPYYEGVKVYRIYSRLVFG